jgi:hypothetical protein
MTTSIDSLAPNSPIFPAMLTAQRAPWVRYHNIVGRVAEPSFLSRISGDTDGDGVVETVSARVPYAMSEIAVPADHSNVHNHPLAVLEVQRVLREHLRELRTAAAQPTAPQNDNPPNYRQSQLDLPWQLRGAPIDGHAGGRPAMTR